VRQRSPEAEPTGWHYTVVHASFRTEECGWGLDALLCERLTIAGTAAYLPSACRRQQGSARQRAFDVRPVCVHAGLHAPVCHATADDSWFVHTHAAVWLCGTKCVPLVQHVLRTSKHSAHQLLLPQEVHLKAHTFGVLQVWNPARVCIWRVAGVVPSLCMHLVCCRCGSQPVHAGVLGCGHKQQGAAQRPKVGVRRSGSDGERCLSSLSDNSALVGGLG